jgi:hypothetical protein
MTALKALEVARRAGITVHADGDDLVLEAAAPPPTEAIALLSLHKAEVITILAATDYENNEQQQIASRARFESVTLVASGEAAFEQPCAARRGRVEEHADALLHFCVECGRFGPYGYGVRLLAGQLGRWYCREHRPQDQRLPRT